MSNAKYRMNHNHAAEYYYEVPIKKKSPQDRGQSHSNLTPLH